MCQRRCLPFRLPGQVNNSPLSQKDFGCVSVCRLYCAMEVAASQELSFHWYSATGLRNSSPTGHHSQTITGHPLGSSYKAGAPDTCTVPFWEMLALWGMAEGQHKGIAQPLRPLETTEVGPYLCVEVQPCLSDCTYEY